MARRALALKAQGVDLVDLGAGEPDFPTPRAAVEAARRALADGFTKYTAGSGMPSLREEVAAHYCERWGSPWSGAEVVISVGGKAALFEIAMAVVEPGVEVIIPSPCWVSLPAQIELAGGTPVLVETDAADGFSIHAGPLLAAVTPRTRAILINSPGNPTGGLISRAELRLLVAGAAARGLLVIADETYARLVYDGAEIATVAALAAEYPETVALAGSFSKTYAMTGWRIGYVLGPSALIGAVSGVQSHVTSNPTSFAMVGALTALRDCEPDVERMLATYQERRDFLIPRLNAIPGLTCRPPGGAFYAFPRAKEAFGPDRATSVELAEYLLETARVAVVPGSAFGADDHIRLSFATSIAELDRGVERIARALGG
ncbi:MAG TPA: pyridoxal phosphate-dependent aminotransferase [Thermoanaerobaculia bacterium]|nr:pyridoxal phosphate-dependent aminotransferase [Thermoanaerobaculia bacterium]